MKAKWAGLAAAGLMSVIAFAAPAQAQKSGGVLRLNSPDSPANMSMLEAATLVAEMPLMGVFNNLILFDQHKPQVSLATIVPDLAKSWSWNEDGTEFSFVLRQGVKWHDGQPFTAADVKCTWDLLLDQRPDKLRLNPRKTAYYNLAAVTTDGDFKVTFHLKRPQPAFPMLLASGFAAIYPCHVSAADLHRPLQICRIPTQGNHQGRAQPRLLEKGSAVSRRHRIPNHNGSFDSRSCFCRRKVRHDLSV